MPISVKRRARGPRFFFVGADCPCTLLALQGAGVIVRIAEVVGVMAGRIQSGR